MKSPVRIAVTGAAGQISYSLLFRLLAGDLLGLDQPIILHLLEIPQATHLVDGVVMELQDCASPRLAGIVKTSNPDEAFADVDFAFLIGSRPRGPGMERKDLLKINAEIFAVQGKALDRNAKRSVKVLVVGNPANTNALIAMHNAPGLPKQNFSAMTRLDHNRTLARLSAHLSCDISDISQVTIWGNHSATQFPDLFHARINGESAISLIDESWYRSEFIPAIQQRGAAIIKQRGRSSAASAANAAIDHMRDWCFGTRPGDWVSMAVASDGHYDVDADLVCSFPVTIRAGEFTVADDLSMTEFAAESLARNIAELQAERDVIRKLL